MGSFLVDSESEEVHEILSISPDNSSDGFSISDDDRMFFFERVVRESDIWRLTLNEER